MKMAHYDLCHQYQQNNMDWITQRSSLASAAALICASIHASVHPLICPPLLISKMALKTACQAIPLLSSSVAWLSLRPYYFLAKGSWWTDINSDSNQIQPPSQLVRLWLSWCMSSQAVSPNWRRVMKSRQLLWGTELHTPKQHISMQT